MFPWRNKKNINTFWLEKCALPVSKKELWILFVGSCIHNIHFCRKTQKDFKLRLGICWFHDGKVFLYLGSLNRQQSCIHKNSVSYLGHVYWNLPIFVLLFKKYHKYKAWYGCKTNSKQQCIHTVKECRQHHSILDRNVSGDMPVLTILFRTLQCCYDKFFRFNKYISMILRL